MLFCFHWGIITTYEPNPTSPNLPTRTYTNLPTLTRTSPTSIQTLPTSTNTLPTYFYSYPTCLYLYSTYLILLIIPIPYLLLFIWFSYHIKFQHNPSSRSGDMKMRCAREHVQMWPTHDPCKSKANASLTIHQISAESDQPF